MPFAASSRAVLVTGASRGIGAATARAFATKGDRVALHFGSRRALAVDVASSLPGAGHLVVGADLADPDATKSMVDEVAASFGGIDVLVNNAGVVLAHTVDDEYEVWQRVWRETIAVNLVGAANVSWCAIRHMGRGGRIVNVASRGAFRGEPGQPGYGASKAGIVAFGQSLAQALGPRGIAVSSVAPGFTSTARTDELLGAVERSRREVESPLGRMATADEVAAAIVYLASPEAEFTTGTVLDVNGASYLHM